MKYTSSITPLIIASSINLITTSLTSSIPHYYHPYSISTTSTVVYPMLEILFFFNSLLAETFEYV